MHQKSPVQDLLREIETIARPHHAKRISAVTVRLGALSQISSDEFRDQFEEETKGTFAEGARLEVVALTDDRDPHAPDVVLDSVDVDE